MIFEKRETVLRTNAIKSQIVRDLFVRTADENYIAARWCFLNGLDQDFLWLALHATEKYYKACLAVNGFNTKKYSHSLTALHESVKQFAPTLLPNELQKPSKLIGSQWRETSIIQYLNHLETYGNQHSGSVPPECCATLLTSDLAAGWTR